jgi:hypothetical protein
MVQRVNAHVLPSRSLHLLTPVESVPALAAVLLRSGFAGLHLQQFRVLGDITRFQTA